MTTVPTRRSAIVRGLATLAATQALSWPATGIAQSWPTKPIRLVVPFPPGGSADVLARLVGSKLATRLAQPVIVDNRAGAGGILGADAVAKAPADGHTLLFANTNIAINPSLYKQLPYDTTTAFAPVVLMVYVPNLFLVRADAPYKTLRDFVEAAKARPGALNYASAGNGTFPHLAVEMFKEKSGVSITHVPYKGAAPALNALLAGEVDLLSNDLVNAMQHVKAGKLRPLAITSTTRSPIAPDVPTMAEAGIKDFQALAWQGIMAPAGTPQGVITQLNAEINRVLAEPATRDFLLSQGLQVAGGTAQQFGDFIQASTEAWRSAVKASGATAD
ncbi:MAG: tripartite tricarboxylate transporter substrate binding protein [Caldimonas sp.]